MSRLGNVSRFSSATTKNIGPQCRRQLAYQSRTFQEGDVVLVKGSRDSVYNSGKLSKPLRARGRMETSHGVIDHSSILGQRSRDTITSNNGVAFRLHEPSLNEYVCLTPRLVTPIYPKDASLIVSQLDLHLSPPPTGSVIDDPPLEILEAGTGHGSLTLQLARAIHAANAACPPLPNSWTTIKANEEVPDIPMTDQSPDSDATTIYEEWRRNRRAIIHTVDISKTYSDHARKVVRGFRSGLYFGNVDFHVGRLCNFFERRAAAKKAENDRSNSHEERIPTSEKPDDMESGAHFQIKPISTPENAVLGSSADAEMTPSSLSTNSETTRDLSSTNPIEATIAHCILDLPGAHHEMNLIAQHLHVDGKLIVFVPSVTQIADCVDTVKNLRLPLSLSTVLELGTGISGGREWDVRAVKVRSKEREKQSKTLVEETASPATESLGGEENVAKPREVEDVVPEIPIGVSSEKEWAMVCRPKVGDRVAGGGFIAVWTKLKLKERW